MKKTRPSAAFFYGACKTTRITARSQRLGYHFIHKRFGSLIPRLEAVLLTMEADGTIRRIQEETLREFIALCP